MPRFSGQKLKDLRGRRTQHDLADALRQRGYGTTQTQVSRWESGQAPRKYILEALAEVLGVKPDELYEDDEAEAASMEPLSAEAFARDVGLRLAEYVDRRLAEALGARAQA